MNESNTTDTTAANFETRLAALERSARRWRVAAVALAGVVVVAVAVGAGPGDPPDGKFATVRCQALLVEEAGGKLMAGISAKDGSAMFRHVIIATKDGGELCSIGSSGDVGPNANVGEIFLYSPTDQLWIDAKSDKPLHTIRKLK